MIKKNVSITYYLLSQWTFYSIVLHKQYVSLAKLFGFHTKDWYFYSLWLILFKNIAWEKLHVSIVVDADVGLWVHVKWYSKGSPFWYTLHTPLSLLLLTNLLFKIYIIFKWAYFCFMYAIIQLSLKNLWVLLWDWKLP